MYAHENGDRLPELPQPNPYPNEEAFFFKELMKGHVGLSGPPRPGDPLFLCPAEKKSPTDDLPSASCGVDYSDYMFNFWLKGTGLSSVQHPARTTLVVETPAGVSYSFHQPQSTYYLVNNPPTAQPFLHAAYQDALNEVSYVDGHINYIRIYNNGFTLSGTYDPPAGYDYQWSKD